MGDRRHAYELIRSGVDVIQRETFSSALDLGVEALKLMGMRAYRAHRAAQIFKQHDEAALREVAVMEDDDTALIARSRQLAQDLERILQADAEDRRTEGDRAWDISTLRTEAVEKDV
ncbi:hypothetical protein HNI00_06500 [Thermoleptolyngbya oregonensis NK1-22]|uniref:Uncharacterized protein n=1 Tax=Thermoleptolyngbya oregonensis NK1-22 TaxID=2547457 RepID=A0AA97BL85_9CYAN|nr:hypothetical protein [Thermoleptolyngbya oregonensis]WOB42837.1 hypothetical protein HNI00_06500 [Thermoleptolyngbya oregonensis NK1-22]